MDIYIYHIDGDHLKLDSVCDKWFEILWTRRFLKCDDFTIRLPPTAKNIELFSEGKVIELAKINPLSGASEHAGIITAVTITAGEKSTLTVSGQSFDGLLDRRILTTYAAGDTAMTVFRKNAGDLATAARRFDAITFDTANDIAASGGVRSMQFKTLADYANYLATNKNWGLQSSIVHDSAVAPHINISGRLRTDRSTSQSTEKCVIFSDDRGNATDFERKYSDSGAVTSVVVGSMVQHNESKKIDVQEFIAFFDKDNAKGYDRIEKYQSITPTTSTETRGETEWSVLDYSATWEAAALLAPSLYSPPTDCLDFVPALGVDWESKFFVGDIITAENRAWGVSQSQQITEIQEFWGADSTTETATLGDPPKRLMEIIKQSR